jgi:hypothetical protein
MDGNRPRDDCRGEQEREGNEYPCVSKPRTIAALVGTHGFARSGASNLANRRWRSGSLIIRTQRSNRRVEARNLIAGTATVDLVSQAFGVLDHGTVPYMAKRIDANEVPDVLGTQTLL